MDTSSRSVPEQQQQQKGSRVVVEEIYKDDNFDRSSDNDVYYARLVDIHDELHNRDDARRKRTIEKWFVSPDGQTQGGVEIAGAQHHGND